MSGGIAHDITIESETWDLLAQAVLIGLGISKFSMGLSNVAQMKRLITQLNNEQAKKIADDVTDISPMVEVRKYLKKELVELL